MRIWFDLQDGDIAAKGLFNQSIMFEDDNKTLRRGIIILPWYNKTIDARFDRTHGICTPEGANGICTPEGANGICKPEGANGICTPEGANGICTP